MIRLVQTFGAHAGRTIEHAEGRLVIGRRPECGVAFDPHADLDASGLHAEIYEERGAWMIRDLGSRNGTWIAGQRVETRRLVVDDEIAFGRSGPRLRVDAVDARPRSVRARARRGDDEDLSRASGSPGIRRALLVLLFGAVVLAFALSMLAMRSGWLGRIAEENDVVQA